jgi:hypothetical protein
MLAISIKNNGLHWHKPDVISCSQRSKRNSTNKSEFEFELAYNCFGLFCNDRRYVSASSIPTYGYYLLLSIFTLISFQTGTWSTADTRYSISVRRVLLTNSLHTCCSYCGNCAPYGNIATFHRLQKVIQWGMLQRTILQRTFLSIKSGCYNENRCYNERGGILSADVACACA